MYSRFGHFSRQILTKHGKNYAKYPPRHHSFNHNGDESKSYIEALKVLSAREVEVLDLALNGYTNREISEHLKLSLLTIETHKKKIHSKLGIKGVKAIQKWHTKF